MESPPSGTEPLEPGDPTQIGAYRLLGRLGAGGMGQVYLGVSRGGRKVAVKVLRSDMVADEEFRGRFAREVSAARMVNGFYTAPVVDADPNATPPWMVTAYVPGPSLASAVAKSGPMGEAEIRSMAAALAEGLASIHDGGLVHRDLKPANIILASDGPRIIDFGIARAVGTSTMTAKGMIIGTFTYMSPEQVKGLPAGPSSDVFALGAVLVFAATGRSPFEADSLATITYRILSAEPDLSALSPGLRALVSGCLAKEAAARPTLDQLLTQLEGTAPAAGHRSTELATPSRPVQAVAAQHLAGQFAPPPVMTPPPAMTPSPASQPMWSPTPYGHSTTPPLPSVLLSTSGWNLVDIAFSPDGRVVAGSTSNGRTWRVFFWDVASQQLTGAPVDGLGSAAPKISFSPDGRLLILREASVIRLIDLATHQFVGLDAEDSWRRLRFSPDGRLLATMRERRRATGFAAPELRLWQGATRLPAGDPFKLDYAADNATFIFSPDSRYLFFGHEGQVFLSDVTLAKPELRKLKDLRGTAGKASFSADGRLLAVPRSTGNIVSVLDPATEAPLAQLSCGRELTRIEFSPAGPLLATAMVSRGSEAIEFWYLTSSAAAQSWPTPFTGQYTVSRLPLAGFQLPVSDMRFSPDGVFLAAASRVDTRTKQAHVRTWAVSSGHPGTPFDFPGPVQLTGSRDSRDLAARCSDKAVRVLTLRTATLLSALPGTLGVFAPSSGQLATAEPGGLRLWTLPE